MTTFASSGLSAAFAEVWQEADNDAVRWLFGARPAGRATDHSIHPANGNGSTATSSTSPGPFGVDHQAAEQAALSPLLGGPPQPELSGSAFSYRHDWGGRRGQWTLRLNMAGVTARSRVFASVGEGIAGSTDAGKFMGSARYTLYNVAPRAGGVDIWINIEWSADILLYVDYLVVNP